MGAMIQTRQFQFVALLIVFNAALRDYRSIRYEYSLAPAPVDKGSSYSNQRFR